MRKRTGAVLAVVIWATATLALGQENTSTEVTSERQEIELLKKRIEELAKGSTKSLWLLEQFKAAQPGLHAPPAMPNEDAYYEVEQP